MLAPVKWLKEYVEINIDTNELSSKMIMSGSKIENITITGDGIQGVVVGKIEEIKTHPNADKLAIVKVNVGNSIIQIVTGASNISEGDFVPVALHGAKLQGGIEIKKGKIRGEVSEGMLCSMEELAVPKGVIPEEMKNGIWILDKPYSAGQELHSAIPIKDEVLEFEITSNRPDCLSMIGIAREVAATIDSVLITPVVNVSEIKERSSEKAKVVIEDREGCCRYVARVIKDVNIQPSPQWMQQRLIHAGVRPINNIVDITNYVMLEYGQPLHAFDLNYIEGSTIIVRKAEEGEVFKTLDGVSRTLKKNMTVIADLKKAVAVGGVMGGEDSEVTSDTKCILLESANFNAEAIRLTSKQLSLRTEASSRFEKGVDPNIARLAADRACQLIEELGAGKILEGAIDIYPEKREAEKILIRPEKINRLLGISISAEEMAAILNKLEMTVQEKNNGELEITVPTYRMDLQQEADFAEEVGRIYGYDKIQATMAKGNITVGGKTYGQTIQDIAKYALNAMGLNEILTYSFASPRSVDYVRVSENNIIKRNFVKLLNPLGEETSVMRTGLLPNLLEVLQRNFNRKVESVKAFEIGNIFINRIESEDIKLPNEISQLAIGMYGKADFFTLKGVAEGLLKALGIKDYEFEAEKFHPAFHPGRCANLFYGNHIIGILGEIHPEVAENYGFTQKCYCAEIDFDALLVLARISRQYEPLPRYPAIVRDFAVVVEDNIPVKEIENIIKNNGGDLLEDYRFFDIYKGNQIPDGFKSVAYTLTYRNKERTLTDQEVNNVNNQILLAIKEKLGGTLRD